MCSLRAFVHGGVFTSGRSSANSGEEIVLTHKTDQLTNNTLKTGSISTPCGNGIERTFLDFLHRNGLKTVFDNGESIRHGPGADILAEDIPCETMKPLCEVASAVRVWRRAEWRAAILRARLKRRFLAGIPVS